MKPMVLSAVLIAMVANAEGPVPVAPAAPGPKVRVAKATPVRNTPKETVSGSLSPSKLLPMGFEVGGRLASSKVTKGEVVKAGQLLGSLDTEIVDAQVAQAEAGVAAAEAGAGLASDVAMRNEKLKAEGSVSDVQSKQTEVQAKQAAAQVALAKAQLAQARAARKRHEIRALFAGTVIDAPDNTGGMVGPGTPVFIVMQLDPLVLKATVPESMRSKLKVGTKVRVDSVATAASTDEAVVKAIIPSADPSTRRVPVEIFVPNADGRFTANTLARVSLPTGEARAAFLIPSTAMGTAGGDHVFAVGPNDVLKRVPVTVVERKNLEITVIPTEPLDRIVDYPTGALTDGTTVSLR